MTTVETDEYTDCTQNRRLDALHVPGASVWDMMGAACAIRLGMSERGHPEHLLGSGAGRPEFAMLSLDGTVALFGTTWETGIGSLMVPNPGDTEPVHRGLDWAATRVWDPREEWLMGPPRTERDEALAWLRHREPTIANRA
ncbi:hypothetical protein [Embleya sp. NPDC020630]|uniref:hypothetical protein n=1 Tax=Embleya sp. NPDC020630 TaxID=3363979 RepID=UPI00378D6C7C